MSSHTDIAKRIAAVIISPETAVGFMAGVLSVPKDLGYMAYGFMDTDSRSFRREERIRMTNAIRYGLLQNHNLRESIQTTLNTFTQCLPEKDKDKLVGKMIASIIGRLIANTTLSAKLANAVVVKSGFLLKIGTSALGNILLVNGMAERSIYTSARLKVYLPDLWHALYVKNHDLLYFLIEPAVQPFTEALHLRRTQGEVAFERVLSIAEEKINEHKNK